MIPDNLLLRQAYQEVIGPANGRSKVAGYAGKNSAIKNHYYFSATTYSILFSDKSGQYAGRSFIRKIRRPGKKNAATTYTD